MSGETDLDRLLQGMQPELNPGEYVFCTFEGGSLPDGLEPLGTFLEREGWTVILPREQADAHGLPYSFTGAWITLTVHSALEAVGLTAAISQALAGTGISCNVVAAYYHDHIFVPLKEADRAVEVLRDLAARPDVMSWD